MAIPNPNPNIADGVKCDNKTYSSNKIESLISTATDLPIPEAGDAGKVLTVNSDADGYELDTPFKSVITKINTVTDTTATATDLDIYTVNLDKGIYIFNGQTLWKTTSSAKGLTMIAILGSDTINQNLEYTDGWCIENLTSVFEVTTDNTSFKVRLYQSTGSSVDIEFSGNITKIG